MNTNIHFWSYLSQFFLEWEMFRARVVEKIKTHVFIFNNSFRKLCLFEILPDGATARGGPWPPLQCTSKPLGSLLCLSIRLHPSFSGPCTRHPAISFLVFLFALLHTAFRTTFFFGISVSCILSICPSHRILWHLINLTVFSPLVIASNSSFRRILHNSFSFTGPYIFRKIFLSNTANALSSSMVSVHDSEP